MECPDDRTLVMFADDELDAFERPVVERHLPGCESCRAFVEEMRSLASLGRSSLRMIDVPARRIVRPVIARRSRAARVLAFASLSAAAIVLVVLSAALVMTRDGQRHGHAVAPAKVAPPEVAEGPAITPLADEAFERWAARYRRMRIPLVPMEDVQDYAPPPIRPTGPDLHEGQFRS